MKRLLSALLVTAVLFLLCTASGCASPVSAGSGKLKVTATIFPAFDFVREIGGEHVTVTQLLRPGAESHTFDPTPEDIVLVGTCDLFLCAGGESDAWVDVLLESSENENRTVLRMTEMVECVEEETSEGMTVHEHEEDSDEIEYDEHVWTSLKNAVKICETITDTLCALDPENEADYRASCAGYTEKLRALDAEITEITENAAFHTLIFGDRFPFRYFCDDYGLSYRAAFPGCAAESEPSAATMAYLIGKIRDEKIPAVFTIELSNGKIAEAIAEETGAEILRMHSCHNRTAEEYEAGLTYLDLMKQNIKALEKALNP